MAQGMRVLLLGLFGVLLGTPASGEELVELFKRVSPAVGALYAQEQGGNLSFNCTVTIVEKTERTTILITAYHCATKDVAYAVTFDGRQFYSARVWKIPHDELDKQKYPRHYGEPKTDMAFFLIDQVLPFPIVRLATTSVVDPGRRIATVGFPLRITKVRYEGLVSGRLDRPGDEQNGYLILQVFGAPGSSGTAVVDVETGQVLGVLVSGTQGRIGLPVVFATPIEYEKYLLEIPGYSKK
jgi:S1-C subfamily serine protease